MLEDKILQQYFILLNILLSYRDAWKDTIGESGVAEEYIKALQVSDTY